MGVVYPVLALLLVAACSGSVLQTSNSAGGNFELLILHNNDMHARFEQTSQLSGACTTADRDAGKCYGGFPRVAHVVKEARRAAASGEGPPVLYLNAGDTYTGTAWFTIYKWKIAAEFLNALQPDAVALGNDEFEMSYEEVSPFINSLNTKILASNVVLANIKTAIEKSVIFNFKGTKVGVIGYLSPENKEKMGNNEYINDVIALKEEVKILNQQNVKIIIALGHSNSEKDFEIAKSVDGIDLVISGHKNSYYWNGTNSETNVNYNGNKLEKQASGYDVLIVKSFAYNKYMGRLKLKFNAEGEITEVDNNPLLLDKAVPQDAEALKIVNRQITEHVFNADAQFAIGDTAVVLDGETCGVEECNFGNLIADAISYYYSIQYQGERWTDAPITIIPGGAIRSSIAPSNRPATVTTNDLLEALPNESHVVAVTMNGTVLLQVLEHSVAHYVKTNPAGEFLQFSGVRVVYDLAKEPGNRIVSAVVRCWSCFVPQYFSIDDRDYKLLMPASLADGEFEYSMLVGLPKEEVNFDELTATTEFIRQRTPVYPEVGGRITLLNLDAAPDSASTLSSTFTILFVTIFLCIFH